MNNFKVGDRVGYVRWNLDGKRLTFQEGDIINFGTITNITSGKTPITVKWDDPNCGSDTSGPCQYYMLESKCKPIFSKLEAEFKVLDNEVRTRLEIAGKLLLEADKIAKQNYRNVAHMEAAKPLTDAMEAIGWRTSSLTC